MYPVYNNEMEHLAPECYSDQDLEADSDVQQDLQPIQACRAMRHGMIAMAVFALVGIACLNFSSQASHSALKDVQVKAGLYSNGAFNQLPEATAASPAPAAPAAPAAAPVAPAAPVPAVPAVGAEPASKPVVLNPQINSVNDLTGGNGVKVSAASSNPMAPDENMADGNECCDDEEKFEKLCYKKFGRKTPILLDTLNESQVQDILRNLSEDDTNWYFVPLLEESDTDLSRYSPQVKRQLGKLGSYIYGPSTIYSGHCPAYGEHENATQRHHEGMKDMIESRFGWLLDTVRRKLAEEVSDPVEWMSYPYIKMHRGDSLDALPSEFRDLALKVAPPHRDQQFMSYVPKEQQPFAQTLTFTLPIQVPSGGAGLRCFDAFLDKPSGKLLSQQGQELPRTGQAYQQLVSHLPYEDVVYLPGRMLLFSGDQLHAVSPYKNPISSDRRIVLQGHGIFQEGVWKLFG
ncbi:unnamed protein product [Durusdinium trenchii]|uniref:Fe2OG dioxygenase domain-containing protein n=1 Tax=Durusdinium trenchii TaxID=1381693 RepID=A0ABP0Q2F2_9DINO